MVSSLEIFRFLLQGISGTFVDGDLYFDEGFEIIGDFCNSNF